MPRFDLHCHSIVSDGVLEPSQLAQRVLANKTDVWSLTDHDEIGGIAQARQASEALGLGFIAGVEISVTWAGRTIHVVGLGIDETNPVLVDGLAATRHGRLERGRAMAAKLEALGIPGCLQGALKYAGNESLLSRTHFARYLVEQGHVRHMQEVFDRYLGDDGIAYVPTRWASLEDAINWIRQAGGIAVLAHPGRYKYSTQQFDALFAQFRDLGGVGIEVVTGSHAPAQYQYYAQVARNYGFHASCGSDFHSPDESRMDIGTVPDLPEDLSPVWKLMGF